MSYHYLLGVYRGFGVYFCQGTNCICSQGFTLQESSRRPLGIAHNEVGHVLISVADVNVSQSACRSMSTRISC